MDNKNKIALSLLISTTLTLVGCAVNPVADLCKLDANFPDEVVASTVIDGSEIGGSVITSASIPDLTVLPSAIATTVRPYIDVQISGSVCYGPYGPQTCIQRVNLQNVVYGIGRADNLGDAEYYALRNCQRSAEYFLDSTGIWVTDNSLDCKIRKVENCLVR